jgi:hypothetical protein
MRVARERAGELQRRGQRAAAQRDRRASGREHRDLQARLDHRQALAAEAGEQATVSVAAAQEHVLAVVEVQPVAL